MDFVVEDPAGHCVGIEVKASRSLNDKHFSGLRDLELEAGGRPLAAAWCCMAAVSR